MPKRKQNQVTIARFEDLVKDYSKQELIHSLTVLKGDLSWKILRSALMQEYLRHVPVALDYSCRTGKQIEASYEAGVSQTLFDVANTVIDNYIYQLENSTQVVQSERPEE